MSKGRVDVSEGVVLPLMRTIVQSGGVRKRGGKGKGKVATRRVRKLSEGSKAWRS